ncbi:MAG: hypothetical protein HOP16_15245 [Acidobacteria bacterium]|nr:hypothetical protein [Acidobacteriota bacterium]
MFASKLAERRRRGTEDLEPSAFRRGRQSRDDIGCQLHRFFELSSPNDGIDEGHHRWIPHPAPVVDLFLEERRIVLTTSDFDAVVVRIQGLDDGLARLLSSTSASRNLCQQLKGPLRGSKICEAQPHVRGNHPHERHAREIVTLGNHLRADDDVDLAGGKLREPCRQGALRAD